MKTNLKLLAVLATLSMTACSSNNGSVTKISGQAIMNSDASPEEKAEQLAKGAEELLTAQGIPQADQLAQAALDLDANNVRAQLIKSFTAPVMLQKGILARVRPLAKTNPLLQAELDESIAELQYANPAYHNLLTVGPADITTEAQLQDHLDKSVQALEVSRQLLKKNFNKELTVKATTLLVPNILERYAFACTIKSSAEMEYEVVCPDAATRYDVKFNRADFAYLHDAATYFAIQLMTANAYDISGSVSSKVAEVVLIGKTTSNEQLANSLLAHPQFAKLRASHHLGRFKNMGLDLVSSLNWAIANQSKICPSGWDNPENRPGYWRNSGHCYGDWFRPMVDIVESVARGKTLPSEVSSKSGPSYTTSVDALNFYQRPTADLRKFGPFKFTKCDTLQSINDASLGGILPKADANHILALRTKAECK